MAKSRTKNFDDAIGYHNKQVKDDFFDDPKESNGRPVDLKVDLQVDLPTFQKVKRLERKVFSVKTMLWVDKFVDDLVHELDKRGVEISKGKVTEKAFKLLHSKMKSDGISVKIRKEFLEEFDSV